MARALIAEPSADVRALLRRAVARLGIEPVMLERSARDDPPDVDVLLLEPGLLAGIELARTVRRKRPSTAIVVCSIYPPTPELTALRPSAYLMKPFQRADLERGLRRALADSARDAALAGEPPAASTAAVL